MTSLRGILDHKREEVEERRRRRPVSELRDWAREQGASRGFTAALRNRVQQQRFAVIAEVKRASPSKGVLREDFDPLAIARQYMLAGASCLSVLTDAKYFMGSGAMLDLIRKHCPLPVLRKDFIIDTYQIYESKALGADCMLLIVAALDGSQLQDLFHLARENDMDVLVEVHDEAELTRALSLGEEADLIGINNRNLHTFDVDLALTLELATAVPPDKVLVSESGIHSRAQVERLRAASVYACLVGEALVKAADPAAAFKTLFGD